MRPRKTVYKNAEIPGRIHAMQPFLSEGKLPDGTRRWWAVSGPAVSLGHLPRRYHASARSAVYVVYSYDTPIAWVVEPEEGTLWYDMPDVSYSPTTSQQQYACLDAWADELRRQGTYRRSPASGREVVRVPGNAEAYGRSIRARSGGMDGVRPGEEIGTHRVNRGNEEYGGYDQGLPPEGWNHHPAHP